MTKQDLERLDDLGIAAWDNHKPEAFVELFADRFVLRDTTVAEPITTRQAAVAYVESWFEAFPDLRAASKNRVIGEDSIAAEVEFTGTNTGRLVMGGMELAPTGKSVVGKGTYFVKVKDGKVVEFNTYPDAAGLMVQLGLLPAP
jgi:predicted ester cyclase